MGENSMDKIFQRIIDNDFSELRGMTVDAAVPVPEALLNELMQAALHGNKTIQSVRVAVHPQNKVSADVKTTLLPWSLNLKLKLDKFIDFASYSSPKLRAWMENNRLLGSLGSLFNALPEGVKLYGDQLVVDVAAFLPAPEHQRLLALVKSVGIRTEAGNIILDVRIEVDK
jgi:hypothetical protein